MLVYALLFAIIFAETGLVVTPFLPGDSLLFAAGTIAALGDMNVWVLMLILWVAAVWLLSQPMEMRGTFLDG